VRTQLLTNVVERRQQSLFEEAAPEPNPGR